MFRICRTKTYATYISILPALHLGLSYSGVWLVFGWILWHWEIHLLNKLGETSQGQQMKTK